MFSIIDIIGRNALAVERIAGRADDSEFIKSNGAIVHIRSYYRRAGVEITYIDNIADQIVISGTDNSLIAEFISFLGVRFIAANINNLGVIRYYQIAGLAEVAFYGDREGNIDKVCIKAFTF